MESAHWSRYGCHNMWMNYAVSKYRRRLDVSEFQYNVGAFKWASIMNSLFGSCQQKSLTVFFMLLWSIPAGMPASHSEEWMRIGSLCRHLQDITTTAILLYLNFQQFWICPPKLAHQLYFSGPLKVVQESNIYWQLHLYCDIGVW